MCETTLLLFHRRCHKKRMDIETPHITLLRAELHERQKRNPRYSLRAFAHFLEIHPSAVSRILSGKQELSASACEGILGKLALTPDREREFINSVVVDKANRLAERLNAASLHHGHNQPVTTGEGNPIHLQ